MTLSSLETKVVYALDGVTTDFPLAFPLFDKGDVEVIRVEGMVETPVPYGWEVREAEVPEGAGPTGEVWVRFEIPPAAGGRLAIRRRTKRVQESDYPEAGRFPAKALERDLDRLMGCVQELEEKTERALTAPASGEFTPNELWGLLFGARDEAVASAAAAAAAQADAALSAGAAGSALDAAGAAASRAEAGANAVASRMDEAEDCRTHACACAASAAETLEAAAEVIRTEGNGQSLRLAGEADLHAANIAAEAYRQFQLLTGGGGVLSAIGVPPGCILLWSGAPAAVPEGFALCDGTNGTPDLRDRFVLGAGGAFAPGDAGGAASASVSAGGHVHAIGEIADATLEAAGLPAHGHSLLCYGGGGKVAILPTQTNRVAGLSGGATGWWAGGISSSGDSAGHVHSGGETLEAGGHSHEVETMPPYYALCYIMKI